MRAELGIQSGGKVIARVVDGTVVLEPIEAAIRRAQEMVRKYIPDGKGIVDEFIAERHAAAELE
jgi:bifunctional DNA-binding transcriptional regulator/antitoxin component of YhaV-PrlF toxin-antitoxin module